MLPNPLLELGMDVYALQWTRQDSLNRIDVALYAESDGFLLKPLPAGDSLLE